MLINETGPAYKQTESQTEKQSCCPSSKLESGRLTQGWI